MATGSIPKYAAGEDSGWLSYAGSSADPQVFSGTIYYRRIGNFVSISANNLKLINEIAAGGNKTLWSLPVGYRPDHYVDFSLCSGRIDKPAVVIMNPTTGQIQIYANQDAIVPANQNLHLEATFITS